MPHVQFKRLEDLGEHMALLVPDQAQVAPHLGGCQVLLVLQLGKLLLQGHRVEFLLPRLVFGNQYLVYVFALLR